MAATEKQIRYAMYLLDKAGFSTRYMNAQFKELGATMRERSGSVESWLASRNIQEMSHLIDNLKAKAEGRSNA